MLACPSCTIIAHLNPITLHHHHLITINCRICESFCQWWHVSGQLLSRYLLRCCCGRFCCIVGGRTKFCKWIFEVKRLLLQRRRRKIRGKIQFWLFVVKSIQATFVGQQLLQCSPCSSLKTFLCFDFSTYTMIDGARRCV